MLTYLDSGVLVAAANGTEIWSRQAYAIIDDPGRSFVSSPFLRMETLHHNRWQGYDEPAEYYQAFLDAAEVKFEDAGAAVRQAEAIIVRFGLQPLDAMHVASAILSGASEIITSEGPTKSFHRAGSLIPIHHLGEF